MRIVQFLHENRRKIGIRRHSDVVTLDRWDPELPDTIGGVLALTDHSDRLEAVLSGAGAEDGIPLEAIRLLPPISDGAKIICVGLNYVDHAVESPYEDLPTHPVLFTRFASSFVGPDEPLIKPSLSDQFDWEGELVVYIGKSGRRIPKEDALSHIAGYSIANEGSVRDWQLMTPQWTVGKNVDATGSIGPDLVLANILPSGGAGLSIVTRINGEVMQSANTADMIFDVASIIAFTSQAMALAPGDMILSGTPAGVGFARKPQRFLVPGDRCEVEIEEIGVLKNTVVAESFGLKRQI